MDNRILKLKSTTVLSFLIFGVIFFPTFNGILPGYSGVYLLLFIELVLTFFFIAFFIRSRIKVNKGVQVYFSILLMLLALSIIQEFTSGLALNDVFEIIRPLYGFLFFILFYNYFLQEQSSESFKQLILGFSFCIYFLVLWSGIELFTDWGRELSGLFYKSLDNVILKNRMTGTFGQTYNFSYFMLIPTFFFLIYGVTSNSHLYKLLFLVSTATILLTQSRTMFIVLIVGFIAVFYYSFFWPSIARKRWFKYCFIIFICLTFIVVYYWGVIIDSFSYVYAGLSRLLEQGVDTSGSGKGSVNARFNQFLWAYSNHHEVPLIGAGIGKGEVMLESLYSLYFFRYGVLGLSIFLIFCIVCSLKAFKLMKLYFLEAKQFQAAFMASLSMFYMLSPIALFSSAMQDHPRVSFFFYGFAGLIFALSKRSKSNENSVSTPVL